MVFMMKKISIKSRAKEKEIMKKADGSFELIRRAETPDDYFATFKGIYKEFDR